MMRNVKLTVSNTDRRYQNCQQNIRNTQMNRRIPHAKLTSPLCSAVKVNLLKRSALSMNGTTAVRRLPYAETCGSINTHRKAATRSTSFVGFITKIIPKRWIIFSVVVTANWSDHRLWKRNQSSRSCSRSPTAICGGPYQVTACGKETKAAVRTPEAQRQYAEGLRLPDVSARD